MITGIGHVGIIVKNLNEAVNIYSNLFGFEKVSESDVPKEGIKNAMLKVGGQKFEVMEPYPGSPLAKYIEARGEGIHHVNLLVSDLDATVAALKAKGATIIPGGADYCFVHPKNTRGVLIELCKPG